MIVADRCTSAYLGFPLEVTDRDVTVFDQRGRRLATVASIGAARRFIRGYRRIPKNTEVAAAQPREERAPTTSDEPEAIPCV